MARRSTIIVVLFIGALVILGALFVVALNGRGAGRLPIVPTATTSPAKDFNCELTGEKLTANQNPVPYAVCIDNIRQARPQSGLDRADIVYELLAEGGIPRFLAIYSCRRADRIGPVRSARTYFIDLALQFDAVLAHAGGSPAALRQIDEGRIRSLNQFRFPKAYFRSRDRRAPHNLFTNTTRLSNAASEAGFTGPVNPQGPFRFSEDGVEGANAQDVRQITIPFPTTIVAYQYDAGAGRYFRLMNGRPHVDAITGKQLSAKNVVVQFAEHRRADPAGRLEIDLVGSGKALFFVGGKRIEGAWSRQDESMPFRYEDSSGSEFKFKPGATWVEIVRVGTRIPSS